MRCRQIEQRLHELLDSRLDIDSDEELQNHLDECSECATLAAAYDTLARARNPHAAPQPVASLAPRVVAEVCAASPARSQATWRAWTLLAVAACLLLAVGVALRNNESTSPTGTNPALAIDDQPSIDSLLAGELPVVADREVAGREIWYRAGLNLASISLASLRSPGSATSYTDTPSDEQLLHRALNTIRTLWPQEVETSAPGNGETGWNCSPGAVLVA